MSPAPLFQHFTIAITYYLKQSAFIEQKKTKGKIVSKI
jgi:hypothetical protein